MPRFKDNKDKDKKREEPLIERSSGNVFKDIGFSDAEAVNLLARAQLMYQIERIIKEKSWTQEQAAKALGVSQPRVSDLMTHQIGKFTVDMLMKCLDKLGKEVTVSVKDKEVA